MRGTTARRPLVIAVSGPCWIPTNSLEEPSRLPTSKALLAGVVSEEAPSEAPFTAARAEEITGAEGGRTSSFENQRSDQRAFGPPERIECGPADRLVLLDRRSACHRIDRLLHRAEHWLKPRADCLLHSNNYW